MKVTTENDIDLEHFDAWSGGQDTLDRLIAEGKCGELQCILEDLYPEGIDETHLNDILRFEEDWCYEMVGIETEEQRREREEQEREDTIDELFEEWCLEWENDDGDACSDECPYSACVTCQECRERWVADHEKEIEEALTS